MTTDEDRRKLEEATIAHNIAQDTGAPEDYEKAAELYEICGKYRLAEVCRMTAEMLKRVEGKE